MSPFLLSVGPDTLGRVDFTSQGFPPGEAPSVKKLILALLSTSWATLGMALGLSELWPQSWGSSCPLGLAHKCSLALG